MRQFIYKTLIFVLIVSGIFIGLLSQIDGSNDPYYLRFTTPKQDNLVLGNSQASQGILPQYLDAVLGRKFYNYAFTMYHSPYGPTYYNSIKKKINPKVKDGIFILNIDPWSLTQNGDDPNDSLKFFERKGALGVVENVSTNPNLEYLIHQYNGKYYSILNRKKNDAFLHDNGWLEISISMDEAEVQKRTNKQIASYRKKLMPNRKVSQVRLNYLEKTVHFLKSHGKVYLVRLPIHPSLMEFDKELMPNFDDTLAPIIQASDGYLDMTSENDNYIYTNGNHLWKESGKAVTQKIASWIKAREKDALVTSKNSEFK